MLQNRFVFLYKLKVSSKSCFTYSTCTLSWIIICLYFWFIIECPVYSVLLLKVYSCLNDFLCIFILNKMVYPNVIFHWNNQYNFSDKNKGFKLYTPKVRFIYKRLIGEAYSKTLNSPKKVQSWRAMTTQIFKSFIKFRCNCFFNDIVIGYHTVLLTCIYSIVFGNNYLNRMLSLN